MSDIARLRCQGSEAEGKFHGADVYGATKYAVKTLSEGIRQASNGEIRSTSISSGAADTELTDHITDPSG